MPIQKEEKGVIKIFTGDSRGLTFDDQAFPSVLVVNFSVSNRCSPMNHTMKAFPTPDLNEIPDLTTLDTGSDIMPVYDPVVDTIGFSLSHSSSALSASPISLLYA